MKRLLHFFCLLILLLFYGSGFAQVISSHLPSKKMVTIPVTTDSAQEGNFCICKIVTFHSENYHPRTDAIFAASTPENFLTKKDLLRNIDFELQQAMVFFDSYKLVKQYAGPVDCNTLYNYLKTRHEEINRFTVLLPSYASR